MRVVIAFGSNLGDREATIKSAIESLKKYVKVRRVSSFIDTAPVGGPEQGDYINGVLIGETEIEPDHLMHLMLEIESSLGRVRTVPNAPRTIDLDLIDYEGMKIDSATLTLPHPRAHLREFVISPWREIDPRGSLIGHGTLEEICQANGW